jgi:hypothetical protein
MNWHVQNFVGLVVLGTSLLSSSAASLASTNALPKPPLPPLKNLKVEPATLTLLDGRDEHRVLVSGEMENGQRIDVTAEATLNPESAIVDVIDGYIRPKAKGETKIIVTAAGLKASLPVKVQDAAMPPVSFVGDVEPMMSRVGCNAGTCHGSAKGKNGFKLSLRGYDPEFDYGALINDLSGRRFNRAAVDESLMLLKPTAEVPHEGRQVIKPGSRDYQLLRQWIVEGTKFEPAEKRGRNGLKFCLATSNSICRAARNISSSWRIIRMVLFATSHATRFSAAPIRKLRR